MKRSDRLKPVQRVTEAREDEAMRAVGMSQRQLDEQSQRLQELERYRDEYNSYYLQSGGAGITAQRLQQMQHFLANVNKAIAQQQQVVAMAERQLEERRKLWLKARGRTQAIDKVAERYQEEERQVGERRAQKESDEIAQRIGGKDQE